MAKSKYFRAGALLMLIIFLLSCYMENRTGALFYFILAGASLLCSIVISLLIVAKSR